jgi:hypothetical protein
MTGNLKQATDLTSRQFDRMIGPDPQGSSAVTLSRIVTS